jgi:hypothetical protein
VRKIARLVSLSVQDTRIWKAKQNLRKYFQGWNAKAILVWEKVRVNPPNATSLITHNWESFEEWSMIGQGEINEGERWTNKINYRISGAGELKPGSSKKLKSTSVRNRKLMGRKMFFPFFRKETLL